MNILIIGNGFDLAHGLPTKYNDFLKFIQAFKSITNNQQIMTSGGLNNIKKPMYEYMDRLCYEETYKNELIKLVTDNIWIDYFISRQTFINENWIDFESEIAKVIKSLDRDMHYKHKICSIDDEIGVLSNSFFDKYYKTYSLEKFDYGVKNGKVTFRNIKEQLYTDLNKLIRALEIYIADYIEKMECQVFSPDVRNIAFDKILSFNYTKTYARVYDTTTLAEYDYIHGKADIDNSIKTNSMVLGIDEYLSDDKKDKETDFIVFKKFYQRIYKETGCKYKDWVARIRSNEPIINRKYSYEREDGTKVYTGESAVRHNLYIFGHSLDVTDKDILRELILNDNVYTTIFYLNKDVMGQQIANLVKIIGQDELIKRTGGSSKTIEFKLQSDMKLRE